MKARDEWYRLRIARGSDSAEAGHLDGIRRRVWQPAEMEVGRVAAVPMSLPPRRGCHRSLLSSARTFFTVCLQRSFTLVASGEAEAGSAGEQPANPRLNM